jgi:GT2 family glycosyltransferase
VQQDAQVRETAPDHVALVMVEVSERGPASPGSAAATVAQSNVASRRAEREHSPDLSVIVVTHNRAELALTTLRSAQSAIRELHVQWIVVDSGSSDGTPETIESECPDVQVLREQNVGFAAANNRGLALANGRYVLLLNPDVETTSGTFDELVATLDARHEIGVASVIQTTPTGQLEHTIRHFPSPWLAVGEAIAPSRFTPLWRWREEEPRTACYRSEAQVDWLVGAFLIARAQALQEVGGLDERFFLYSEETDWCYRFRQAGWEVSHLPVMTVIHHTSRTPRPDLSAQLSYAKILFAQKHYGRVRAAGIRAALVLRHCLRAMSLAVLTRAQPHRAVHAAAERRALAVVLGLSPPPFARARPETQPRRS